MTFEQVGILDGHEMIRDFVDRNEWGLALEHLLYIIHESAIVFPADDLENLYSIASRNGIRNPYEKRN